MLRKSLTTFLLQLRVSYSGTYFLKKSRDCCKTLATQLQPSDGISRHVMLHHGRNSNCSNLNVVNNEHFAIQAIHQLSHISTAMYNILYDICDMLKTKGIPSFLWDHGCILRIALASDRKWQSSVPREPSFWSMLSISTWTSEESNEAKTGKSSNFNPSCWIWGKVA